MTTSKSNRRLSFSRLVSCLSTTWTLPSIEPGTCILALAPVGNNPWKSITSSSLKTLLRSQLRLCWCLISRSQKFLRVQHSCDTNPWPNAINDEGVVASSVGDGERTMRTHLIPAFVIAYKSSRAGLKLLSCTHTPSKLLHLQECGADVGVARTWEQKQKADCCTVFETPCPPPLLPVS
jgi:hypothetical protein